MQLFDLHCDTLYACWETEQGLRDNTLCVSRKETTPYSMYTQVFALFCGARPPTPMPGRRLLADLPMEARLDTLLDTAKREFSANTDWLMLCRDMDDWAWARDHKRHAAFLSIEGAELLEAPGALDKAYEAGVRLVALAWNYQNAFACGAATDNDKGLTDRGRALVHDLVGRNMIVDVSHLSEAGFWDVCMETEAPFAATHSNSRACCDHLRNLTPLQFSEIVRRGGLLGLNLYSPFLRDDGKSATIDDVLRHADDLLGRGGEHCLALGSDFDGCEDTPEGLRTAGQMENLAEAMLRHGYLESTVNALFYGNAVTFFTRMLGA